MDDGQKVAGVDRMPLFVVARESDVFDVKEADYVHGVPLLELMSRLEDDQHLYLVHLNNPGPGLGVKLTLLV